MNEFSCVAHIKIRKLDTKVYKDAVGSYSDQWEFIIIKGQPSNAQDYELCAVP